MVNFGAFESTKTILKQQKLFIILNYQPNLKTFNL